MVVRVLHVVGVTSFSLAPRRTGFPRKRTTKRLSPTSASPSGDDVGNKAYMMTGKEGSRAEDRGALVRSHGCFSARWGWPKSRNRGTGVVLQYREACLLPGLPLGMVFVSCFVTFFVDFSSVCVRLFSVFHSVSKPFQVGLLFFGSCPSLLFRCVCGKRQRRRLFVGSLPRTFGSCLVCLFTGCMYRPTMCLTGLECHREGWTLERIIERICDVVVKRRQLLGKRSGTILLSEELVENLPEVSRLFYPLSSFLPVPLLLCSMVLASVGEQSCR